MKLLHTIQRYWHTISHLRSEQIGAQLWMRMRPLRRLGRRVSRVRREAYPGCCLSPEQGWLPPPVGENEESAILEGWLSFVGERHNLGWPLDWSAAEPSKLWQYNLFYFEWLWLLSAEDAVAIVCDWIAFSRSHPEHTAWDPYPTSLRLMNWCGVLFHQHHATLEENPDTRELIWQSICEQVDCLLAHLEFHLMGNHLFENAVALALVGSSFRGKLATSWLDKGVSLLQREVQEQILSDGLHFELSPMYHLRMVYTMLLLYHHGHPSVRGIVARRLPAMLKALSDVCHPDGQIALFNDSAFGIYHTPAQLFAWAGSLWQEQGAVETEDSCEAQKYQPGKSPAQGALASFAPQSGPSGPRVGAWSLPDAGYYGARSGDGNYIICDVGLPGPDYIPGHAHGDIFSFELSLRGHRVIVDSGVYDYVDSELRRYCRSTRAHNTVGIDEQDQSEFWGAFRVARRACPHDVLWQVTEDGFALQAWHDGYHRLEQKRARHERSFRWWHSGRLEVHDYVTAKQPVQVASRLHLHPACQVVSQTSHSATLDSPAGTIHISFHGPGTLLPSEVEESWYCSGFGQAEANHVLVFQALGTRLQLGFVIELVE